MSTAFIALAVTLLLSSINLAAQEVPQVTPGTRIRVWAPPVSSEWVLGTFVTTAADTIVLALQPDGTARRIPLSAMSQIEISRGWKSRKKEGAVTGALLGVVVGGISGLLLANHAEGELDCRVPLAKFNSNMDESTRNQSSFIGLGGSGNCGGPTKLEAMLIMGTLGCGLGAALGAGIGESYSGERWEATSMNRFRVDILHNDSGVMLSASYAF